MGSWLWRKPQQTPFALYDQRLEVQQPELQKIVLLAKDKLIFIPHRIEFLIFETGQPTWSLADIEPTNHFVKHDMSPSDKLHMMTSVGRSLKPDRKHKELSENECERRVLKSDTSLP